MKRILSIFSFIFTTVILSMAQTGVEHATSELIVISSDIQDVNMIMSARTDNQDVLLLNKPGENPLQQVNNYLELHSRNSYKALHIISHGEKGSINLNGEIINSENLNYTAWASVGKKLANNADIMLYACELAQEESGRALVSGIAEASGANVAASTDKTGDNNWQLEYAVGNISTPTIIIENYPHYLATYTVTTNADSGAGSLRDAITQANGNAGTDIISINSGLGTIILSSEIAITQSVNITVASGNAVISGNNATRIFNITGSSTVVTVSNVNFINGNSNTSTNGGGAIYLNQSRLNVSNALFQNNQAPGTNANGGAIKGDQATIDVYNSSFLSNYAANGGAIYNIKYTTGVESGGNTFLSNCTFFQNSAAINGGAVFNSGDLEVVSSTIAGNFVVQNNTLTQHVGGGIFVDDAIGLMNSIILGNTANGQNGVADNIGIGNHTGLSSIYTAKSIYPSPVTENFYIGYGDTNYEDTPAHIFGASITLTTDNTIVILKNSIAAFKGTLTGRIGDFFYYLSYNTTNKTYTWTSDLGSSHAYNPASPDYGLTGGSAFTTAQNKYTNGIAMSRVDTDIAYTIGAYVLIVEGSTLVNNIADKQINPFSADTIMLREAVYFAGRQFHTANGTLGTVFGNQVTFAGNTNTYNIILNNSFGSILLNKPITITGNGLTQTIISGNNTIIPFNISGSYDFFLNNMAVESGHSTANGGNIYIENTGTGGVKIVNSQLTGGNAANGSAVYVKGATLIMENVLMDANNATNGTFYNDGSNVSLVNTTITKNMATAGGGIYNNNQGGTILVYNSIITNNGSNNVTKLSTVLYSNSLVQQETTGTTSGNLNGDTDPMFIDPDTSFSLQQCSPAINKGNNTALSTTTDALGNARIIATTVDMGYMEVQDPAAAIAVWRPESNATIANRQDWDNPANWDGGLLPAACSKVYIRGNATDFPILTGGEECDEIYFLHGGQVGQPQHLTYNKAHVQMNWGLTDPANTQQTSTDVNNHLPFSAANASSTLSRNNWHMFSAPLQKMVSGDFAFGGYPLTFIKEFDNTVPSTGTYPMGKWTNTFPTYVDELTAGKGFVIWINGYQNALSYREYNESADDYGFASRKYGLQQVNGIVEFPYYEDADMLRARRAQKATGTTNTFQYIYGDNTKPNFMDMGYDSDTYDRGSNDDAYRFITETYSGSAWTFDPTTSYSMNDNGTATEILVGNPYMSSIDFVEFYKDNQTNIQPQFRLWTGNSFATLTITDVNSGTVVSNPAGVLDRYIAPMQSFFIVTRGTGTFDVEFNVANVAVAKPAGSSSQLKAKAKDSDDEQNIVFSA